ncbi:MAG: alkaline phosphatase [Chloroflexota bacterium]|nr:alkaline phosphatase [Lentimicrobium sp.]
MQIRALLGALFFFFQIVSPISDLSAQTRVNISGKPKNVILLIGDGMGITEVYAAMLASKMDLNMQRCSNTALVKTNSADSDITDSAAAGTALATGTKTNNGFIGVDKDKKPLKSILKIAEENGLATGMVTTCDITHATPASFIASVENRNQASEIALQFLKTDIDVFIGGGYKTFSERPDSLNLIDSLKAHNYFVATNTDQLNNAPDFGKLAGLLYPVHAPKEIDGRADMLSQAVIKALDILDNNHKGFFLMVEGSQIDWGGHENNIEYNTSEVLDFDKAVGVALNYAEKDKNTLVIVTADHETGGLTLIEADALRGGVKTAFSTTHHTASPVPLFAFGPGSENFRGLIENTDVFKLMVSLYGFNK